MEFFLKIRIPGNPVTDKHTIYHTFFFHFFSHSNCLRFLFFIQGLSLLQRGYILDCLTVKLEWHKMAFIPQILSITVKTRDCHSQIYKAFLIQSSFELTKWFL